MHVDCFSPHWRIWYVFTDSFKTELAHKTATQVLTTWLMSHIHSDTSKALYVPGHSLRWSRSPRCRYNRWVSREHDRQSSAWRLGRTSIHSTDSWTLHENTGSTTQGPHDEQALECCHHQRPLWRHTVCSAWNEKDLSCQSDEWPEAKLSKIWKNLSHTHAEFLQNIQYNTNRDLSLPRVFVNKALKQ